VATGKQRSATQMRRRRSIGQMSAVQIAPTPVEKELRQSERPFA
jgi:hypothetical protein